MELQMNFQNLVIKITPKLKQFAFRYNGWHTFCDEGDLFNEMVLHLWKKWRDKSFKDKTESYIVQSCYFYLRNYLRVIQEKQGFVSLNEPINEDGLMFEEIISDQAIPIIEIIEEKLFVDRVMNNGLSKTEKIIFELLYKGFTIREIGKKLNISHVMVLKHKKKMIDKVTKSHSNLLM
jgi:RNA polymerase sigma factor (sigma-70 family)